MELKVVIEPDPEDGGYRRLLPGPPGLSLPGETLAEARRNIRDAIPLCLEVLNNRSDAPV